MSGSHEHVYLNMFYVTGIAAARGSTVTSNTAYENGCREL